MDKAQLETLLARIDIWLFVFGVIVVIGVAGESLYCIRYWRNSRKLQAIQREVGREREEEIARLKKEAEQLHKEAAEAGKDAAGAKERAAKAEEHLATAHKEAAEANAKAEGFRLDIAKANERAASANETAERERLARLQLEARLDDRVLRPLGRSQLTALAASFPKGTKIDICVFGETIEVANIARAIHESLAAGGWTVRQWRVMSEASVRGILIGTDLKADAALTRAAGGIIVALLSSGIDASLWKFEELKAGGMTYGPRELMDAPIRMFIGSKQ